MLAILRRPFRVGGFYSVVVDDRGFGVARVLAAGRGAVHVRVYSNRYRERPVAVQPADLFLAPPPDFSDVALNATGPHERADPGPFGIGHLPLRPRSFAEWQPRLIAVQPLRPDELDGYRAWRLERGRLF